MAYCANCEDLIFFEDRALMDGRGNLFCCDYCSEQYEEIEMEIITGVAKSVLVISAEEAIAAGTMEETINGEDSP